MRIVTVLQTRALNALHHGSSEFTPTHVKALQRQLEQHAPFAQFQCLSDVRIDGVDTIPLQQKWPGWWAKMELFAPSLKGDVLYMDLDTVITGDLEDIASVDKLTLLRDFYRDGKKLKEGLGSGLMFLPETERAQVWDEWSANPTFSMRLHSRGDQHFLERLWLNKAKRWQDVVPHQQIVSYKVHCSHGVPSNARIICMHGQPRPWAVGQFLHLYRE